MTDMVALPKAEFDKLLSKMDYLTEQFEEQRRRQEELKELQNDLIPIMNHMFKLSIDELAEIGNDFELEDILFLVKRLLRDTHLLVNMLDQLESMAALSKDVEKLIQPIFNNAVQSLDELEHKGYFAFARGLWYITERVTDEFDENDVRELGDNIVTILNTVRNMTQPQIMNMANNMVERIEAPVEDNVSTWQLFREFRDPQVRKGLARMLTVVRTFADDTENTENER